MELVSFDLHRNRLFIYLSRSPSHLALSADVSSQHQKGWLQLQQSGTIIIIISNDQKFTKKIDIHAATPTRSPIIGSPSPEIYSNSAHQAISSSRRSQKFNKSPSVDFTMNH
jgi:hypothetical protein